MTPNQKENKTKNLLFHSTFLPHPLQMFHNQSNGTCLPSCFQVTFWCTCMCTWAPGIGHHLGDPYLHPTYFPAKGHSRKGLEPLCLFCWLGYHHVEMIWKYKLSREEERGICHSQHWHLYLAVQPEGGSTWHNQQKEWNAPFSQAAAYAHHPCLFLPPTGHLPSRELKRAGAGEEEGGSNKLPAFILKGRGWAKQYFTSVHNSGCKAQIYTWKIGHSQVEPHRKPGWANL